jgi:tRNA dimethylallyltransferase
MSPPRLLLLVGPTGVGKTAIGVELCDLLGGEIISADSMQIYRGCDIVTAKVSAAERARAPHHLIDIRDPTEPYSAPQWAHNARRAIDDITARGRVPIIVGGTGFYIRALLEPDHVAPVPPDPALRASLERDAETHGAQWLHDHLATLDALAAARLHPNDTRRVTRAIEVAVFQKAEGFRKAAGRRQTAVGSQDNPTLHLSEPASDSPTAFCLLPTAFCLDMPRPELYARLDARIDRMLELDVLGELRGVLERGVTLDAPVMQGLGYRQLLPALDDPAALPACVELWKRDTRRYAKRQLTWFRHQLQAEWVTVDSGESARAVAERIVGML